MKLTGHRGLRGVCVAGCAFGLLVSTANGANWESQRVKPEFERSAIEQPHRGRFGKDRSLLVVPKFERSQVDRRGYERVNRVPSSRAWPNMLDVFRHPKDLEKLERFPRRALLTIPRHTVPGQGSNLDGYRRGTPFRTREHSLLRGHYFYFRNPNAPKPDPER